jgi:hypothetical protein
MARVYIYQLSKSKKSYDFRLTHNMPWAKGVGIECKHCNMLFETMRSYVDHRKNHHTVDKTDNCFVKTRARQCKCDKCGQVFKSVTQYRNHHDRVHSDMQYYCKLCDCIFKSAKCRDKHEEQMHSKSFTCAYPGCGRSWKLRRSFLNHFNNPAFKGHWLCNRRQCEACKGAFYCSFDFRFHKCGGEKKSKATLLPSQCD